MEKEVKKQIRPMMKHEIEEVVYLVAANSSNLQDLVNVRLRKGWVIYGSVVVIPLGCSLLQSMVKYRKVEV